MSLFIMVLPEKSARLLLESDKRMYRWDMEFSVKNLRLPGKYGNKLEEGIANILALFNQKNRNIIRENKLHQIQSAMQMGKDITGMISFNQSLLELVLTNDVDLESALAFSLDQEELIKSIAEAERKIA